MQLIKPAIIMPAKKCRPDGAFKTTHILILPKYRHDVAEIKQAPVPLARHFGRNIILIANKAPSGRHFYHAVA